MTVLSQDLSKLTYPQLKSAKSEVELAMDARRRETAARIAKLADDTDIALEQVKSLSASKPATNGTHTRKAATVTKAKPAKKAAVKGQVKFRDPDNPKLVWSGRGPRPRWMVAKIDSGTPIDALRV